MWYASEDDDDDDDALGIKESGKVFGVKKWEILFSLVQLAWTVGTRVSECGGDVPIVTRQVLKSNVTVVQRMGKLWG